MNFEKLNTFEGGYSKDTADGMEANNTFEKGLNGRIYSHNGIFSFRSIEGSKEVYHNEHIVKFLGFHSFKDETIVFAKYGRKVSTDCVGTITTSDFSLEAPEAPGNPIYTNYQIASNSFEDINCDIEWVPELDANRDNLDFELPYNRGEDSTKEIDFDLYYGSREGDSSLKTCSNPNSIPEGNSDHYDAIFSFSENEDGELVSELLWAGFQGWPIDGKITTEGIEENEFFKRVYYTDALNVSRVVNIKDNSLKDRTANEFNQVLNNVLLQPEINSVSSGGQLKAMRAMYLYRVISENGQVSEFSPFSFFVDILPEDEMLDFRGGRVSEMTDKRVSIGINLIDPEDNAEVECVALEFEAEGPPSAIKNLGTKPAASVMEFQHYGSEPEFIDDITLHDILEFKNTWKFCNDYTSKKNKLIAGGLRNEPIPFQISDLEYLLPLKGWDSNGGTHDSLINPRPSIYGYIDPTNKDRTMFVQQRVFETISAFGSITVELTNRNTGASIKKAFEGLSLEEYTDISWEVSQWLIGVQDEPLFRSTFPNLRVINSNGKMLFTYRDDSLNTDVSDYMLKSDNKQFILNYKSDIKFENPRLNNSALVNGVQSAGWTQGNGVRITYREYKEPLLNQATSPYDGTGELLDMYTPSMEKYFMKGETYRLAFQVYDKASSRHFAIPLGDIEIPSIGHFKREIDDNGNPLLRSQLLSQSVENGVLYGHGIKLHVEVKLDCDVQEMISMYQLLYVERTEENRTILCQGIAAPLTRVQSTGLDPYRMDEKVDSKWTLPYYGGPVYEKLGLESYDRHGENHNISDDYAQGVENDRVMTHRALMYFDSPDLYYGKISDRLINSSTVDVKSRLNTDHTIDAVMGDGSWEYPEQYPKFSRKIQSDQLDGNINADGLPKRDVGIGGNNTHEFYFINVSVFSQNTFHGSRYNIERAETLERSEIISGSAFALDHDVSNNAMAAPTMPWFFGVAQRIWGTTNNGSRASRSLWYDGIVHSPGYSTVVLKTDRNLFTSNFIGNRTLQIPSHIHEGDINNFAYDSYPLINLHRGNQESVYGGRTHQDYTRNTFIPLSRTIPTSKDNSVQYFDVGGDTYVTLNVRTKNDAGDAEIKFIEIDNHWPGNDETRGDIHTYTRNGAWTYAVVLETQVEPKLDYGYQFYRQQGKHNFEIPRDERINEAYFNVGNMKQFIPKPFRFRDDPDQGNVIAVSDTKLAGESKDSWTSFKTNNFYAELEKNKGSISNLVKFKDQIYAIQEGQTSLLHIGTDRLISDSNGQPINIKQGSGQVVEGHQVLSEYGTSFRRAVAESDYGFVFFDEKHIEFIKMDQPLLTQNSLHPSYWNKFLSDKIIDTESYFDHKNKESNIRVRTRSGESFVLSYNEMFQKFNGIHEHGQDLYIEFDKKIFAPLDSSIHELNIGDPMNLFGQQKKLIVGINVHANINQVFQYKNIGLVSSLKYPFSKFEFTTSLGQHRIVTSDHPWYKIREGVHTVPAVNESMEPEQYNDLRGTWVQVEVTAESLEKNKVDILAIINNLRLSHQ